MKKLLAIPALLMSLAIIAGTIDLDNLFNYESQTVPNYITKDNTAGNTISDEAATLGRVLFYDKQLSLNNTIACGSCHMQEFAFGDTAQLSVGFVGGLTDRHAMRLVNPRFADEVHFFWDERANTLEDQTTQPIQNHVEMGFSGTNGQPDIDSLIRKMENIDYYDRLFEFAYGDNQITEQRIQFAIADFVRSIQSFDSKFDAGLAQVNNINQNFPNFTAQENQGKQIFLAAPPAGGAGCQGCHRAPEFDIDPAAGNNGVISVAQDANAIDVTNTRAPSLRDLVNPNGQLNGPLMHNGEFLSLAQVIDHYDQIPNDPQNTNLDNRLMGPPGPNQMTQNLQLTQAEKDALEAFLLTLTGSDIYTNEKWSDPFDANGNLTLIPTLATALWDVEDEAVLELFPNPVQDYLNIRVSEGQYDLYVFDVSGKLMSEATITEPERLDVSSYPAGIYLLHLIDAETGDSFTERVVVE